MENSFYKKLLTLFPALASGILIALAFPVAGLSVLAWVAFVPLLVSLWPKSPKEAFGSGFAFGVVYFFGTLYWIYHSMTYYGGVSFVASICLVLFLCSYLALFPAVFALLFARVCRGTKLPALFIAPVLWVTLEFARSYVLTGFPWSSIGYSQYRVLPLIQIADISGIYGVSFLVLAVNGALADLLLVRKRLSTMPLFPLSLTFVGIASLLLLIAATLGYGMFRLSEQRPGAPVTISVVQGNIEQDRKWEPAFQNEVVDIYEKLSRNALSARPALLVWPETAVPFYFGYDQRNSDRLMQFQKDTGSYLLFGSVLVKSRAKDRAELTNSVVMLDKEGKKSFSYDKIHLVPFGEYVPLRRVLFFVDKLVEGIGDYVPGRQYNRAETEFGSFGAVVCYEVIFPGLVRKFFTHGGDIIVTITNDAWFGRTAGPYQHFSMAVFRAIENRKPLVRAANTGISGFIDSNGRIRAATGLFTRQVLTENVITDSTRTFYTRYGDLFSYLCIIISIVMAIDIYSRR
ncbi:MAG: apolipoprotein N-acyltransferase [Nitrospirae bacterium]|nr:apolipoprotein N-acyltransferase [Nitrospirota bacterium]